MEGTKEKIIYPETNKIELFKTIKEIGNLLGKKGTIEILQYLSYDPMRYKDLKKLLNCHHNMLSRRLKKLKEYNLITQLPVFIEREKIDEYTLTEKGQELIKFFRTFVQNKEGK